MIPDYIDGRLITEEEFVDILKFCENCMDSDCRTAWILWLQYRRGGIMDVETWTNLKIQAEIYARRKAFGDENDVL